MQACRNALSQLQLSHGTHAGLLLQRYLRSPIKDNDHVRDRKALLDAVVQSSQKVGELYQKAYERWGKTITGTKKNVKIEGRMVLGLSSESPFEVGLRLHHTYGTPVIPGSALKGLASHYCHRVWGWMSCMENKCFQTIFGTTEESGCISFYDAMILPESLKNSLIHDVMTGHHEEYYKKGGSAPSDYDDPNPIPFLSIQGEFTVAVRCNVPDDNGKKWEKLAMDLLLEALQIWGIGGKTSSGYGRIQKNSG